MNEPETGVVEQTLAIAARPETVWRYWTDPERMCDWWGAAADLDPRPGGTCRVEMASGPVMRGEFLELIPYVRIVFSFGWEGPESAPHHSAMAPGSTRVEVTLAPDGDDTILTLRHTGIPADHIDEHRMGWGIFLPQLSEAAAGAA